jgi:Fic family protein
LEAAAHVRVQAQVDAWAAEDRLPEPASPEFLRWLHGEFYRDAPEELRRMSGAGRNLLMEPGACRSRPEHNVAVGRHVPPSSARVGEFMDYFADRYAFARLGKAGRILAMASAHHRFNYIHPFPDGNGRVGRLMSHAMAHKAGIGAHGLWSISRGLARRIESRSEYKQRMDDADSPRHGDLDGPRQSLRGRAL